MEAALIALLAVYPNGWLPAGVSSAAPSGRRCRRAGRDLAVRAARRPPTPCNPSCGFSWGAEDATAFPAIRESGPIGLAGLPRRSGCASCSRPRVSARPDRRCDARGRAVPARWGPQETCPGPLADLRPLRPCCCTAGRSSWRPWATCRVEVTDCRWPSSRCTLLPASVVDRTGQARPVRRRRGDASHPRLRPAVGRHRRRLHRRRRRARLRGLGPGPPGDDAW